MYSTIQKTYNQPTFLFSRVDVFFVVCLWGFAEAVAAKTVIITKRRTNLKETIMTAAAINKKKINFDVYTYGISNSIYQVEL